MMDEKKVLLIVKKIKSKLRIVKALTILLIIAVMLFAPLNNIFKTVIILLVIIASIIIQSKIRDTAQKIFYDECDPKTFYAVIHGIYMEGSTALYDALTAEFIGDFKSSAQIISTELNKKQNNIAKFQYMNMLAQNAFFSGDFDMCTDACKKATALLSAIRIKTEYKNAYIRLFEFFKNFINGNYNSALESLEKNQSIKNSKSLNSNNMMMCYYMAIAHYYNRSYDEASKLFKIIIDTSPKFFITEKAKQYKESINNNIPLEIEHHSLKEAYENGKISPSKPAENKTKKRLSLSIGIILIVIGIISMMNIPGLQKGDALKVISQDTEVNEICEIITIDKNYSLCIFDTPYDEIGVACLKNERDEKYSLCIYYITSPEIYIERDNGYYIYASGNAPRIYFDITDNKDLIPENTKTIEFISSGKTYYFYIFKTEQKYNFANSTGINRK